MSSEAESASQSEGEEFYEPDKKCEDEIHLREQFFERSSNF